MADREFVNRALQAVYAVRNEFMRVEGSAHNNVVDQLTDDLEVVLARFVRAYRCSNPKCGVLIPGDKPRKDVYCSQRCQGAVQARAVEEEQRVAEAMSQYAEGADA